VVLRFVLGGLQAPLFPITSGSVIAAWFPPKSWALPNGLTSTGLTLGAAAAGPLLAWLIGGVGWRGAFLATAPVGLLMAAVWWWDVRDDPAEHPHVSVAELAVIREDRRPFRPMGRGAWLKVLANRDILGITVSYFCMNYVFYLFFNWFFYYLVEVRHLSSQVGGNFTGAQWIVGAFAAFVGGLLCDALVRRLGPRLGCRITAIAGLLLTAPFLVAGVYADDPRLAVALLSLAFGCTQLTEGAFWAAAMRVAGPHAPVATGLMNTGGNLVGGLGALTVPAVAGLFGWTTAVSSGALFAVLAALPWLWIRADRLMVAEVEG
jgi:ACS family glucarate transporter-like MFS transporter